MKPRFIILNNGLKDQRGHYFETSISLAEAARRRGLHPVLATHVDCRRDMFPEWLETYPIFCTDHWMAQPPAEAPDLTAMQTDPYGSPRVRIEEVRGGRATVRAFVESRFSVGVTRGDERAAQRAVSTPRIARLGAAIGSAWRMCRLAGWCADRAMFYLLPPLIDDAVRRLGQRMAPLKPRLLRPEFQPRLRQGIETIAAAWRGARSVTSPPAPGLPHVARSLENPAETAWMMQAWQRLAPENLGRELEYSLIFKRDLERLLAITGARADDHVFLGTAHARELIAVHLVHQRLGGLAPHFHLEFRHPLFRNDPSDDELHRSTFIRQQQLFFQQFADWDPSSRIRLYTDTRELSREYGMLADLRFGVLPIPFRSHLMEPPRPGGSDRLTLTFLGDVRDEKGFHWLPDLIEALMDDYLRPGKVRFMLQASLGSSEYNPLSLAALDRLRGYPAQYVDLVGLDGPLTAEAYYRLVSSSHIVLLPYDRNRYRAASSGTLAEAIAAGRPTVVPDRSWMSAQLPPGGGETFVDQPSFHRSVRKLIDHYDQYRCSADSYRLAWLASHTPDALVQAVIHGPDAAPASGLLAA